MERLTILMWLSVFILVLGKFKAKCGVVQSIHIKVVTCYIIFYCWFINSTPIFKEGEYILTSVLLVMSISYYCLCANSRWIYLTLTPLLMLKVYEITLLFQFCQPIDLLITHIYNSDIYLIPSTLFIFTLESCDVEIKKWSVLFEVVSHRSLILLFIFTILSLQII